MNRLYYNTNRILHGERASSPSGAHCSMLSLSITAVVPLSVFGRFASGTGVDKGVDSLPCACEPCRAGEGAGVAGCAPASARLRLKKDLPARVSHRHGATRRD
jgi:hypothetical protein